MFANQLHAPLHFPGSPAPTLQLDGGHVTSSGQWHVSGSHFPAEAVKSWTASSIRASTHGGLWEPHAPGGIAARWKRVAWSTLESHDQQMNLCCVKPPGLYSLLKLHSPSYPDVLRHIIL